MRADDEKEDPKPTNPLRRRGKKKLSNPRELLEANGRSTTSGPDDLDRHIHI